MTWQVPVMSEKDWLLQEVIAKYHLGACRMTSCVPWWRWPLTKNQNKKRHKNTRGQLAGARSNKAQCRNQGSPQPGSPRSQRAAFTAWPSPWHFEANTDKAGSQRKWWEKLPQWNRRVKQDLMWKWQQDYGTQGTLRVRSVVLFQSSYSQGLSMCISTSANWIGAVPGVVHWNNDQKEGAVRYILEGHLS